MIHRKIEMENKIIVTKIINNIKKIRWRKLLQELLKKVKEKIKDNN